MNANCLDRSNALLHISLPVRPRFLESLAAEGVGFDGSSYDFREVENSDMILRDDATPLRTHDVLQPLT